MDEGGLRWMEDWWLSGAGTGNPVTSTQVLGRLLRFHFPPERSSSYLSQHQCIQKRGGSGLAKPGFSPSSTQRTRQPDADGSTGRDDWVSRLPNSARPVSIWFIQFLLHQEQDMIDRMPLSDKDSQF